MSTTVTVKALRKRLPELLAMVRQGEEILISQEDEPIAKIVSVPPAVRRPRRFGGYEGKIRMAEDFDAPLTDDFWLGVG